MQMGLFLDLELSMINYLRFFSRSSLDPMSRTSVLSVLSFSFKPTHPCQSESLFFNEALSFL